MTKPPVNILFQDNDVLLDGEVYYKTIKRVCLKCFSIYI